MQIIKKVSNTETRQKHCLR